MHEEAQTLIDWHGKVRPQKAHIIIRRRFIDGVSNDIGFVKGTDGRYQAIISDYDSGRHNQQWMTAVKKSYAEHGLIQQAARQGLRFLGKKIVNNKPQLQFMERV